MTTTQPIIACALATLLCAQGLAIAQPRPADAYTAGSACFEQLDFACAVDLLTAAAFEANPADKPRRILIQRRLAESHLALGHREKAVAAFVRLLEIDSKYTIEAPGTSPKILEALQDARLRSAPAEVEPSPQPATPPEVPLRIGIDGGAAVLVGRDRNLLDTGFAAGLELIYRYSPTWQLGGGLRYATHGIASRNDNLHLVGGWAGAGLGFDLGAFHLDGMFGLGGSRFGVFDGDGKSSLLMLLRLAATYEMHARVAAGIAFTPNLLLTLGDFDSSVIFCISGQLVIKL